MVLRLGRQRGLVRVGGRVAIRTSPRGWEDREVGGLETAVEGSQEAWVLFQLWEGSRGCWGPGYWVLFSATAGGRLLGVPQFPYSQLLLGAGMKAVGVIG